MSGVKRNVQYCGFDDTWLIILGIPISSLIMSMIISGREAFISLEVFRKCVLGSMLYTAAYWMIFREIFIYFRQKFPDFSQTSKRLLYSGIAIIIAYTLLTTGLLCSVERYIFQYSPNDQKDWVRAITSSMVVTITILAIYEGIYYFKKIQDYLVEKEVLLKEQTKMQLEALRNQINPHFLFNSLNTLMTIIPENTSLATAYLQKLSQVFRYVLDHRDEHLISLEKELEFIRAYIFLQKERFGEHLKVNLNVDESCTGYKIPTLTLQLLFENAIKHNIISSRKPLQIDLYTEGCQWLIIKNNLQRKDQIQPSTKVGLENIQLRYKYFTTQDIIIKDDGQYFQVTLPLIK